MMRRTIRSMPDNHTKKNRRFGVMFGVILLILAGFLVWKFPPSILLEIIVVLLFGIGLLLIRGKFLVILILGLPVLYRLNILNIVTVSLWLLVLGLTALIN